jgi:hypothetical protein
MRYRLHKNEQTRFLAEYFEKWQANHPLGVPEEMRNDFMNAALTLIETHFDTVVETRGEIEGVSSLAQSMPKSIYLT